MRLHKQKYTWNPSSVPGSVAFWSAPSTILRTREKPALARRLLEKFKGHGMVNPVKWLKFILTDEDNQWDVGILIWVSGCLMFLWKAYQASPFDFQAFGVGFAAVLAGGAGLQWIRTKGKS